MIGISTEKPKSEFHINMPQKRSTADMLSAETVNMVIQKKSSSIVLIRAKKLFYSGRNVLKFTKLRVCKIAKTAFKRIQISKPASNKKQTAVPTKKVLPKVLKPAEVIVKGWSDLPPSVVDNICLRLNVQDIIQLMQITKATQEHIANSTVWNDLASRYSIHVSEGENAKERVCLVFKYFSENTNGRMTKIKDGACIEDAMKVYPASWIIAPVNDTHFNVHCHHPSGEREVWQIDTDCKNSKAYLQLRTLASNPDYTALTL